MQTEGSEVVVEPDDLDLAEASRFRTNRLKLAVLTSIFAKGGTFIIQLVALPLAIASLGTERFAGYTVIVALVGWCSLASLGTGNVVAIEVAKLRVTEDKEGEVRIFTNNLLLVGFAAASVFSLLFTAYQMPASVVFGPKIAAAGSEISTGLLVAAILASLQLFVGSVESVQAGYQQMYLVNLRTALSNIVAAGAIVWVSMYQPTVPAFVLAVYAPPLLAGMANALYFWVKSARHLQFAPRFIRRNTLGHLIKEGSLFSLGGLSFLLVSELYVLVLSRASTPDEVLRFAVMKTLTAAALQIVVIFTMQMWPALSDAKRRRDFEWLRNHRNKLLRYGLGYAVGVGFLASVAGPFVFPRLYGPALDHQILLVLAASVYFICNFWEHAHYALLTGYGYQWSAVSIFFIRSVLSALIAWPVCALYGATGALFALAFGNLLTSCWILPLRVREKVAAMEAAA